MYMYVYKENQYNVYCLTYMVEKKPLNIRTTPIQFVNVRTYVAKLMSQYVRTYNYAHVSTVKEFLKLTIFIEYVTILHVHCCIDHEQVTYMYVYACIGSEESPAREGLDHL